MHWAFPKIRRGGYASESEVIREGLRALQERDAVVERWLQDEVGPTLDRYRADPTQGASLDDAFDNDPPAGGEDDLDPRRAVQQRCWTCRRSFRRD